MRRPWHDLARWISRARPPLATLLRALVAGTLASAASLTLLIGAPYLLVEAAGQPGWHAIAGLLIVIELVAFLRSPLRFVERMSSHELGLSAVVRWRRWLTATVGTWPYTRFMSAATGDLLERALADTDVLQDLWLRSIIPFTSIALTMLGGDLVVAFTKSSTIDAPLAAITLLTAQVILVVLMVSQLPTLVARERLLRSARSRRAATRLELQSAASELELLKLGTEVRRRLERQNVLVANAERRSRRSRRLLNLLVALGPFVTLFLVEGYANHAIVMVGPDAVVVALLAIATIELLAVTKQSLVIAVSVTAATERLDALEGDIDAGTHVFPENAFIDIENLTWNVDEQPLFQRVTMSIPRGRRVAITGPSGAGKSTMLRLLARLDDLPVGTVTIDTLDATAISEESWRAHVSYVGPVPSLLDGVVDDVIRVGRVTTDDVTRSLAAVGLRVNATDRFAHLSQGEAQRASLVRGLLNEPTIVLLDEPTNGLGPDERTLVLSLLGSLSATIVIASHDPEVIALCDDVYELANGRVTLLSR